MSQDLCDRRPEGKKRLLPLWMLESSEEVHNDGNKKFGPKELKSTLATNSQEIAIPKDLPVLNFIGKIHYYTNVGEASVACEEIRSASKNGPFVIGFDLEWTPTFQPKREPCTAVLQICTDHFNCHIFHLAVMSGFPLELRLLIQDDNIIKVGVGIKNDMWKLGRNFLLPAKYIIEKSAIDLSTFANQVLRSSQNWSLERLVHQVLNQRLPKDPNIRCGNWDRYPLTPEQLKYAALDAYASFLLYEDLKSMEEEREISSPINKT